MEQHSEFRRRDLQLTEVEEHHAPEDVARVYGRIKETLRANVVNFVWRVLAAKPAFLEAVWNQLEPAVDEGFLEAADAIRAAAIERVREAQTIPDQRTLLGDDLHEAVQQLRVFLEVNPRLLVLTSALRLSWEQGEIGGAREAVATQRGIPEWHPDIATEESPSGELAKVYDDIRETLDLPAPNTDYKALGRFPDYFVPAWRDLRAFIGNEAWSSAVRTIEWTAKQIAVALPARIDVSPKRAGELGLADHELDEVASWIRVFDEILPGLIVNTSYLWIGMNGGEEAVKAQGHPSFEKPPG
ncbi:MAG: halocarboxylic acid dehydrogenase DehI family protein [Actinomycetota bacterium]